MKDPVIRCRIFAGSCAARCDMSRTDELWQIRQERQVDVGRKVEVGMGLSLETHRHHSANTPNAVYDFYLYVQPTSQTYIFSFGPLVVHQVLLLLFKKWLILGK